MDSRSSVDNEVHHPIISLHREEVGASLGSAVKQQHPVRLCGPKLKVDRPLVLGIAPGRKPKIGPASFKGNGLGLRLGVLREQAVGDDPVLTRGVVEKAEEIQRPGNVVGTDVHLEEE